MLCDFPARTSDDVACIRHSAKVQKAYEKPLTTAFQIFTSARCCPQSVIKQMRSILRCVILPEVDAAIPWPPAGDSMRARFANSGWNRQRCSHISFSTPKAGPECQLEQQTRGRKASHLPVLGGLTHPGVQRVPLQVLPHGGGLAHPHSLCPAARHPPQACFPPAHKLGTQRTTPDGLWRCVMEPGDDQR